MGIRTVIQGGVGRFLGKGYELQLGSDLLRFETEEQFKIFLKARANVAAETLATLKELSAEKLERQLARNERIYKHTLGLLLQVAEHGTPVEMLWRDLDISKLPDEQQWPALLFGVSANEELPEDVKREAVERFVEFLRARKALLLKLLELSRNAKLEHHQETTEFQPGVDDQPPEEGPLGASITGAAMTRSRRYQRLPAGKPLLLELHEDESVNLYLSRWKIALCIRAGSVYVEEGDNAMPLKHGENSLGRSSSCDIALSNAPLEVSRKHLIIDWLDGGHVALRDVSTKGTWVPQEYVAGQGEAITGD